MVADAWWIHGGEVASAVEIDVRLVRVPMMRGSRWCAHQEEDSGLIQGALA